MGDEQDRHAEILLQLPHQVEDLRLDRNIERGRRLIGDQQRRLADHRHGNHHALAHAAREFVGVAVHPPRGFGDLDQFQHFDRAPAPRRRVHGLVQEQHLADLVSDREQRVERRHRLLENHRHLDAAQPPPLRLAEFRQFEHAAVAVAIGKRARRDPAVRRKQAHQRQRGHRFTGAALAHQRKRPAATDAEADVAQRRHLAPLAAKADVQSPDIQNGVLVHEALRAAG